MYPSMLNPPGEYLANVFRLQEHLDELLSGGGAGSSIRAVSRAGAFPALNVGTWADALEIYAFAPGIDPSSIQVTVEKSLLVVSGERRIPQRDAQEGVISYARERFDGPFRRVVTLPDDADATRVEATYKNGVLKIVVPKSESAKPRQVQISSGRRASAT
ncbi:MAG: Hsp20/alpha crystallin family protein [Caldimonas sp.]